MYITSKAKIFVIDPRGEIRVNKTSLSQTYHTMAEVVDHIFPSVQVHPSPSPGHTLTLCSLTL